MMINSAMPTKFSRRGSMPGRVQRRASLSGMPERRGSMTGIGGKNKGPSHIMLSWFTASETVDEVDTAAPKPLGPLVADTTPPPCSLSPPVLEEVQITGLELLKKNSKYSEVESDDFSYDSYAQDSFVLTGNKVRKASALHSCMRLTQSEHPKRSLSAELDDDDEMDSMAHDYYDYDYGPSNHRPARLERQTRRWSTQRSSLGSYANDSVEYGRYRSSARRGSIGSFANDSVEFRNLRSSSRFANPNNLGMSWHGNNNNKFGKRGSLGRRGSLGSQISMDSSAGGRFACRGVMRRHSSHCAQDLEKMRKSLEGRPFMRRSSLGSVSSAVSLASMSTAFSRAA